MAALPKSPYPRLQNDFGVAVEAEPPPLRRADTSGVVETAGTDLIGRIDDVLRFLKDRAAPVPTAANPETVALEARMAQLQAAAAHLQRDVALMRAEVRETRERLYRLQDRVAKLPTRGFLSIAVLIVLAAIAGATVYQPQLQAFVSGTLLFDRLAR